jgi:tetratricopeptide (TPR) repeat protein
MRNASYTKKKAVEVYKTLLMFNSLDLCETYNSIGAGYFELGDYENMREYYTLGLRISEKNYKDVGWYYYNGNLYLGFAEFSLENYDESLNAYFKALNDIEQRFTKPLSPNETLQIINSEYATLLNNIAADYENKGEYQTAADYEIKSYSVSISNGEMLPDDSKPVLRLKRLYEKLNPDEPFGQWVLPENP